MACCPGEAGQAHVQVFIPVGTGAVLAASPAAYSNPSLGKGFCSSHREIAKIQAQIIPLY